METRLWSMQKMKRAPKRKMSSFGYGCCVPDKPAGKDGWAGYWWAHLCTGDTDISAPLLIRARDVRRAWDEHVDLFVPGLWGTVYETVFTSLLESLDTVPRKYLALYEGEILPGYTTDEWELFRPVRLVEVMTPRAFLKRFAR